MKLHVLLSKTSAWAQGVGPDSDIVMSSRVRLARNIEGIPFPSAHSQAANAKSFSYTEDAVKDIDYLKNSLFVKMDKLDAIDRDFLVERHIISREFVDKTQSRGVVIEESETASVMINEEDHLRLQVFRSGLDLERAWDIATMLDDEFEKQLTFAFSPSLGYLTSCPTNVGTGMRSSVMLHLPALTMAKQITQVLQAVIKLGLTVRGLYGEGSEAAGNFFQISNQLTLGVTEHDIISSLNKIIKQIIGHEKNARDYLFKKEKIKIEDTIWRSYGILTGARMISSRESIDHLSALRMGIDMGIVRDISYKTINELFITTQPAHLQKLSNKVLEPARRDVERAELIRSKLLQQEKE